MNDHEKAARLRAKGKMKESASQERDRKAREKAEKTSPSAEQVESTMDAMRRTISLPRSPESFARARAHQINATDVPSVNKSTTRWSWRKS